MDLSKKGPVRDRHVLSLDESPKETFPRPSRPYTVFLFFYWSTRDSTSVGYFLVRMGLSLSQHVPGDTHPLFLVLVQGLLRDLTKNSEFLLV